ncbi:uncharacterized protein N7518_004523 [Penicillium psychrosexuale]|uniref:uncharacterized protein n=1 Tax=Penicillium psychrosexuale TaxID=1002107 RepID=UPI002545437B|nr:uncharacterized protein N7518_004523 [Penicillium psychrosexuale]KAJ5795983.1 hypothetical protein N7518_004523 [Penicillium psychrosexuale]
MRKKDFANTESQKNLNIGCSMRLISSTPGKLRLKPQVFRFHTPAIKHTTRIQPDWNKLQWLVLGDSSLHSRMIIRGTPKSIIL